MDAPTEEEGFDGEALHDLLYDTYGPNVHEELAMMPFTHALLVNLRRNCYCDAPLAPLFLLLT